MGFCNRSCMYIYIYIYVAGTIRVYFTKLLLSYSIEPITPYAREQTNIIMCQERKFTTSSAKEKETTTSFTAQQWNNHPICKGGGQQPHVPRKEKIPTQCANKEETWVYLIKLLIIRPITPCTPCNACAEEEINNPMRQGGETNHPMCQEGEG